MVTDSERAVTKQTTKLLDRPHRVRTLTASSNAFSRISATDQACTLEDRLFGQQPNLSMAIVTLIEDLGLENRPLAGWQRWIESKFLIFSPA